MKAAVGSAAVAALLPLPNLPKDIGFLWKCVVVGLVAITVLAAGGIITAVFFGKGTDVLVTLFTTTLAAVVGLFVKSPIQK